MRGSLQYAAFRLPSIQRFLGQALDALRDYRTVLVLLPEGIAPDAVWDALLARLDAGDYSTRVLPLVPVAQGSTPAAEFGHAMDVCWTPRDAPRTVKNLMCCAALPDVTRLSGIEGLHDEARGQWLTFVAQWASCAHARADAGLPCSRLCLVANASAVLDVLPEADTHLARFWWWGFPSRLEVQLLCRSLRGSDDEGPMARWREACLPSLAPYDLGLVEALWDHLAGGEAELHDLLVSYARSKDWNRDLLSGWQEAAQGALPARTGVSMAPEAPTGALRRLWARGAFGWSEEYGPELHIAACAAMDSSVNVQHRLWRGQADLVLPLLEQVRLQVCDYLTAQYGSDWPTRWVLPLYPNEEEEARREPRMCQWGHIERVLSHCGAQSASCACKQVTSAARGIRNKVAHGAPVAFSDYVDILRKADVLGWGWLAPQTSR